MSLPSSELVGLPRQGSRSAFVPNWMCLVLLGWLACLPGVFPAAKAQTNAANPAPPANRYLLLVETSRTMQSRGPGALQTIQDLLGSGLKGQMHVGDTLGVWTFSAKLNAGQFPLQDWAARGQGAVILRVVNFLKEQPFERKANFDKVWPELAQLIQDSPFLTIVMISSGETEIHGTPFDAPINESYRTWRDQQQKSQMPFVTVLRAKGGKITHYAVAPAPWSPELPPLPPELLPPLTVARPASAAPSKPQPAMAAPLIISGKKPVPPPAPEPLEPVAPEPLPVKASASIQTNQPETRIAAQEGGLPSLKNSTSTPVVQVTEPTPAVAVPSETASPEPVPSPSPLVASRTQSPAPPSDSPPPSPTAVPVAVANPTPDFFHRPSVWAGSLLLVGAFSGLCLWARRSRPTSHVSLITQSLERQKR